MPEYEFQCSACQRMFIQYFSYENYGLEPVNCPSCGSSETRRKIKRIQYARSQESRIDNFSEYSDAANISELEKDPRALGGMMLKMSHEIGEEMGPEFNEVVDRLERGQSPIDIEKDSPYIDHFTED